MRLLLLVMLLCLATIRPAMAQVARVTTGEHGPFTRVVVELPGPSDWLLGRSPGGYVLRVTGQMPRYDLASAFDRIDRRRVAALWADPADGLLRIALGCACHAIPFEFRPGIIVIDLRDGPAPPGSSFELALDGSAVPPGETLDGPRPRSRSSDRPPFDWRDIALGGRWSDHSPIPGSAAALPSLQAERMRDRLLLEFARAAGQGLVDPAGRLPPASPPSPRPDAEGSHLRIGDPLVARPVTDAAPVLAADGSACPADDRLAIGDWGSDLPAALQLSDAMSSLTGEFDRPDPPAVERAVRLHLHLGFGVEAVALLAAFPIEHPDIDLWRSMARLVDGQADPSGPFAGLAGCDGSAALWSRLADPAAGGPVDAAAVIRTFSALPPHLRRHLGPLLAKSFLDGGDDASAALIGEAVERLPGDSGTALLAARLAVSQGDPERAADHLAKVLEDPGPNQRDALVALIHLHAADGRPLPPDTLPAIQAYLAEGVGTPDEGELRAAAVLAAAMAERFDLAFAELPRTPEVAGTLWSLLARGPDSAILTHAVGASTASVPADTRAVLSDRLLRLGFPAEAQRWAGDTAPLALPPPASDPVERSILQRDWANLAPDAPAHWQDAADSLSPPAQASSLGPLARSRALGESSAATRAAIDALLRNVAVP